MEINDKVVLLTGASRGIGPFIAGELIQNGAKVIGVARSREGLENTQKECGDRFTFISFDLNNVRSLGQLVSDAKNIHGPIDILVNNAGVEHYKEYHKYSSEEVTQVLNVNLLASMELTRLCLPDMMERGGHVVSIASLAGKKGVAYNTPYSASKSGLIMWTDGMRQEYRNSKVKFSVICPGYISDAGMFYDGHVDPPKLLGTSKPEKVAKAVLDCIKTNAAEKIVNSGPIKPLLALGQISPRLGDWVVRKFGVPELSKKRTRS